MPSSFPRAIGSFSQSNMPFPAAKSASSPAPHARNRLDKRIMQCGTLPLFAGALKCWRLTGKMSLTLYSNLQSIFCAIIKGIFKMKPPHKPCRTASHMRPFSALANDSCEYISSTFQAVVLCTAYYAVLCTATTRTLNSVVLIRMFNV